MRLRGEGAAIDVLVGARAPLFRLGVRAACEAPSFAVVGEFAADASHYLRDMAVDPAVVVVEIPLLGADAASLVGIASPRHRLLIVDAESLDKPRMLRAGASGFISPDITAHALRTAVRDAHAGQLVVDGMDRRGRLTRAAEHFAQLTPRETEVLRLLAEGHSTEEAARNLHLGASTVKAHLRNASAKLGARTRTAAVAKAAQLELLR
jgi:DNA-binding NarL/FixJ family response regulator